MPLEEKSLELQGSSGIPLKGILLLIKRTIQPENMESLF